MKQYSRALFLDCLCHVGVGSWTVSHVSLNLVPSVTTNVTDLDELSASPVSPCRTCHVHHLSVISQEVGGKFKLWADSQSHFSKIHKHHHKMQQVHYQPLSAMRVDRAVNKSFKLRVWTSVESLPCLPSVLTHFHNSWGRVIRKYLNQAWHPQRTLVRDIHLLLWRARFPTLSLNSLQRSTFFCLKHFSVIDSG